MKTSSGLAQVVTQLCEVAGPRPRVVVAFSGGVDSTLLAHVLARQRRKLAGLRLLHVDHRLQAASAEWARHCARVARRLRVPLVVLRANIERQRGESPEAAARAARYALLAGAMRAGEVLVTAQHRDDQAETLLLQLFRGAGVAGLASMPRFAPFGPGHIARPLLETTRSEIETAARAAKLQWVEDPSNHDVSFSRNFCGIGCCPRFANTGPVSIARWPVRRATSPRRSRCSKNAVTRTWLPVPTAPACRSARCVP
jgi:tRNA(Ile)-lysidine synthase